MKKPQIVPSILGTSSPPISLVIASLGNPGRQYAKTRHNAGHLVLAGLREVFLSLGSYRTQKIPGGGTVTTYDSVPGLVLMESAQYMNVSDKALQLMLKWHDKNCAQGSSRKLLVLHDELDLPLGKVAFKAPSRAKNGHNGLRSIVSRLPGTDGFSRIRIGIGRPESKDSNVVASYVLGKFTSQEMEKISSETLPSSAMIVQEILDAGVLVE